MSIRNKCPRTGIVFEGANLTKEMGLGAENQKPSFWEPALTGSAVEVMEQVKGRQKLRYAGEEPPPMPRAGGGVMSHFGPAAHYADEQKGMLTLHNETLDDVMWHYRCQLSEHRQEKMRSEEGWAYDAGS